MERDSAQFANRLVALGAHPGDRVAVQVDKSPEALCLYLGCVRAGLIYLPLNTGYPAREPPGSVCRCCTRRPAKYRL